MTLSSIDAILELPDRCCQLMITPLIWWRGADFRRFFTTPIYYDAVKERDWKCQNSNMADLMIW